MKAYVWLLIVVLVSVSGCGTLVTQLQMDEDGRCPGPQNDVIDSPVYSGVVYDLRSMTPPPGDRAHLYDILFLIDLPLSAVADTLMLPFTLNRGRDEEDTDAADLARTQAAVSFREEDSPDTTGFLKHWDLGSQSAWYNTSTGEVLVVGPKKNEALRISGFPKDYGHVVATGWEDDKRFFVHVSTGADTGTMIYCDLKKREVTEVKRWGSW